MKLLYSKGATAEALELLHSSKRTTDDILSLKQVKWFDEVMGDLEDLKVITRSIVAADTCRSVLEELGRR